MSSRIRTPYRSMRLQGKDRARVVSFVLWPDSMDVELVDRMIDAAHVQGARSPLHDRDVYVRGDVEGWLHRNGHEVDLEWTEQELRDKCSQVERETSSWVPWMGDLKKPHYHYVLAFEGSKTAAQVVELVGGVVTYIEKVVTKQGTLAYLIHRKNPEKAQYDFDEIKVFGGMDLSSIYSMGELERLDYKDMVMDVIFAGKAKTWVQLVRWCREQHDYNLTSILYSNKYLFEGTIISLNSEREARRRLMGAAPEPLREFEAPMFDTDGMDDLPLYDGMSDEDDFAALVDWVRRNSDGPDGLGQFDMTVIEPDWLDG